MGRVFLHVGAPKTGTTYLQDLLWRNRRALRRQGTLYWGSDRHDHFRAAQDLRGRFFRGHQDPKVPGSWTRLAAAARAWEGPTVLVSHEVLSTCTQQEAARAVASLHPHEVHVVYTARDLARQIPAMWQESVKNGRVEPYHRYLRMLQRKNPHGAARVFWRTQDAVDVLHRWGAAVPAERTHVLTVPARSSGDDTLWRRFCTLTGLDAAGLDATASRDGNVSLGLAEAELLRRLNRRLEGELAWPEHERLLKHFLTRDVLTRQASARARIPAADREWVLERSLALVDGLRERGYDVVGSLDELVPDFSGQPDFDPRPDRDRVLEAAVDALAVILGGDARPRRTTTARRMGRLARAVAGRVPLRR